MHIGLNSEKWLNGFYDHIGARVSRSSNLLCKNNKRMGKVDLCVSAPSTKLS